MSMSNYKKWIRFSAFNIKEFNETEIIGDSVYARVEFIRPVSIYFSNDMNY